MSMKKDLTLAALTLLLGGLAAATNAVQAPTMAGNLGCGDVSGCSGKAHCDGSGSVSGSCAIACGSGEYIACNIKY